jgi:hypothetical protein
MVNVESLQQPDIKPGMMPGFGPFLIVHFVSSAPFSKQALIAG